MNIREAVKVAEARIPSDPFDLSAIHWEVLAQRPVRGLVIEPRLAERAVSEAAAGDELLAAKVLIRRHADGAERVARSGEMDFVAYPETYTEIANALRRIANRRRK